MTYERGGASAVAERTPVESHPVTGAGPQVRVPSATVFRPDIEGLRGVAILSVVAFHCGLPGFSGGFVGVDVFFVLSGYLITKLLFDEVAARQRLNLVDFYARRVRRLMPVAALSFLATLVAGAIILAPHELTFAGRAARATALYASNIFFAINAADYFQQDVATNPMLHTWSLAVEEQFYIFWPLLIMLGLQVWRSKTRLNIMLAVLTVGSLAFCVWSTEHDRVAAFYSLPTRAWEFGLGALAVSLSARAGRWSAGVLSTAGWIGLLGIAIGVGAISADHGFPGWVALVPVAGTALALVAGSADHGRGPRALLSVAPLQTVGTLSYSWYLWHWPFLVLSTALWPNISVTGKIISVGLAFVVAAVVHRFVENPIRFHPKLKVHPWFSLATAMALTVCSLAVATLCLRIAAGLANRPDMRAITAAVGDISDIDRNACVSLSNTSTVKTCTFGDSAAATTVVLFGDSKAIQWFNPVRDIANSHHWQLVTVLKSGCPASDVIPLGQSRAFERECAAWRAQAMQEILARRPALVVLGNGSAYIARDDAGIKRSGLGLREWQEGTRRTLGTLSAAGLKVAQMRDGPLATFDIPACLARAARNSWYPGGGCEMDRLRSLDPRVFEAERIAAQGLRNVSLLDVTDQLCERNTCWAQKDGGILYRDNSHLTGSFSRTLRPVLERQFEAILAGATITSTATADVER